MKIKTYIINLKSSPDRREYMEKVMAPFDFLDVEFIDAVDGRLMSEAEVAANFDQEEARKHYGRILRPGEIGCTLSHKKCAKMLLDSGEKCALFLEDDLVWQTETLEKVFDAIGKYLDTGKPLAFLISGDYWYTGLKEFDGEYKIATVTDAVCTQSYFINRAGAERLLAVGNWHLADDWRAIRRAGVKIKALSPHVADQNRADLETVIAPVYGGVNRRAMSLVGFVQSYWKSLSNKVLVKLGHFEEKSFVWKNK